RVRVSVAPLRYGAGVKGKIVTSLQQGVPVVTTSIGNEGLDLEDGKEALLADDAESFAALTVELYTNPGVWNRLAATGSDYVRRHFCRDKDRAAIREATGIIVERCTICGTTVNYAPSPEIDNLREARVCSRCGALCRNIDLARCIIDA